MGTRADFYIEKPEGMEWLGSIGWDGYPEGMTGNVLQSTNEQMFRSEVSGFIDRSKGTRPEMGWPWPWEDSGTTDYAYVLRGDKVYASSFGGVYFDPLQQQPEEEDEEKGEAPKFPDMSAKKNVTYDAQRSGLIILGG